MSAGLLSKVRKISWVLQESPAGEFPFDELCNTLSSLTDSDLTVQTEANKEWEGSKKFHTVVPILGGAHRLGNLVLEREAAEFDEDDLVLAEYAATLIGLEFQKQDVMVRMAIGTLSYSETEAIHLIFKELGGNEGFLVASKIADRSMITRSVIVSALRKLESAGVVESRSLGMKGTYIRILNSKIVGSIEKLRT